MLLAGVAGSSLLFSTAIAQEDSVEVSEDLIERTEEAAEDAEARQEKIVVTGSLLRRDEYSSAAPIQVITAEVSTLEGLVDTADILQGSSVAAGSVQFNNQFNGFVVEGGTGINSISLRGLGAQRSLVLLNGRRPGPAGVRGQVGSFDLNVIPRSAITQVEILKDGASSVYGSDAVAGVANIITRTSVDEPEITVQYNHSFASGGDSLSVDGAYGLNFDTGNIVLSGQYTRREDLSIGDRDFLSCPQDYIFDANTGERIDRVDRSILAGTSLGGCSTGNLYFNTVLDAFDFGNRFVPSPDGRTPEWVNPVGIPVVFPGYRLRENGTYADGGQAFYEDVLNAPFILNSDAINKQEVYSFFGTSDFEIGGVNWDTEWLWTRRETTAEGWRQFFPYIGSATLAPFCYGYAKDPGYDNPFQSLMVPILPFPSNTDVQVDYYSIATGLDGEFNFGGSEGFLDDWAWSLDFVTSKSEGTYGSLEILNSLSGDWFETDDAPTYDPFDPGALSGQDTSWHSAVSSFEEGETTYEQSVLTGIVTGPVFELPAGEVLLALGAEWREFSIDDQPSEGSINGDLWGKTSALVTKGEDNVVELFGEVEVPILAGQPLAEELSINGSFRTFEYDSYGSDDVYKVGLNWQITPQFRVRGTQGTSYRAPALYELFLGNQTSFAGQFSIDPCVNWADPANTNEVLRANCEAAGIPGDYSPVAPSAEIITGGGRDVLEAETSEATTVGFVWTPTFVDLSLAIDYFEITVEDQVGRLGAAAILGGCYGAQNFPNAFCDLFERAAGTDPVVPYAILTVNDSFLNINEQTTEGIDITARYERSFDFGDVVGELQATRTLEDVSFLFDADSESGFDVDDFNGTIGDPEWVANGRVTLERGDFTYSWLFDYVGETSNAVLFDDLEFSYLNREATRIYEAEMRFYHDVSVQWAGDKVTITGGISNLFDEDPPIISTGTATRRGNVPLVGQYDLRGRTAFLRATKRF